MQNLINTITPFEWGVLTLSVIALVLALLAWRRAGRALQLIKNQSVVKVVHDEGPEQQAEQRPAVKLQVTADKNEFDQVSLVISNHGLLAARRVEIDINEPENIYDAENIGAGIETANVTTSAAIKPRLAVLDAENKLPLTEILPGQAIELPAALTMAHGKICDFPVTMKWNDESGTSHNKQFTLTV